MAGGVFAVALVTSAQFHWHHFHSTLYPYSITQPTNFQHVVGTTSSGGRVDYFFPVLLGSFPTNVNISAARGKSQQDSAGYLRSISGRHVVRSGWLTVAGQHLPLIRATFNGLTSTWIEEQVSFTQNGYCWRLTASYEVRYTRFRKIMLRMLSTFKLR